MKDKIYFNKSMVEYVLDKKNTDVITHYTNCAMYAYALSQKPRLGNFIPCDENDVPLNYPRELNSYELYFMRLENTKMKEYQQACDRVLFEGITQENGLVFLPNNKDGDAYIKERLDRSDIHVSCGTFGLKIEDFIKGIYLVKNSPVVKIEIFSSNINQQNQHFVAEYVKPEYSTTKIITKAIYTTEFESSDFRDSYENNKIINIEKNMRFRVGYLYANADITLKFYFEGLHS